MSKISDKAMLTTLHIGSWGARRNAKTVAREAERTNGAIHGTIKASKILLPAEALAPMAKIESEARAVHYAMTLPWAADGARILSTMLYWDWTKAIRQYRERYEAAAAVFVEAYPRFRETAPARMGDLYSERDWPTVDAIAGRFAFKADVIPFPSAEDFRVELSADEVERVRADIEERTKATVADAMRDAYQRAHDAVSHMAEKLAAYGQDADGNTVGKFRDSLVENVRDLARLLPGLNVTGDAGLAAVAERISGRLVAHDAQELRDVPILRSTIAAEAQEIVDQLAGYLTPEAV